MIKKCDEQLLSYVIMYDFFMQMLFVITLLNKESDHVQKRNLSSTKIIIECEAYLISQ